MKRFAQGHVVSELRQRVLYQRSSRANLPGFDPALQPAYHVALGKVLHFSASQFPLCKMGTRRIHTALDFF